MGTIRVEYSRQIDGAATSVRIGGSVDLPLAKDADWQVAWREASKGIQELVDAAAAQASSLESAASPADSVGEPAPEASSVEPAETPEMSQSRAIVPMERVAYEKCRVMFDPEHKPPVSGRKETVRMRIGNPDIPGRYVDAKSFEPDVMHIMRQLRKGDYVDILGHFDKPWKTKDSDGEDEERYDLVVQTVSRV